MTKNESFSLLLSLVNKHLSPLNELKLLTTKEKFEILKPHISSLSQWNKLKYNINNEYASNLYSLNNKLDDSNNLNVLFEYSIENSNLTEINKLNQKSNEDSTNESIPNHTNINFTNQLYHRPKFFLNLNEKQLIREALQEETLENVNIFLQYLNENIPSSSRNISHENVMKLKKWVLKNPQKQPSINELLELERETLLPIEQLRRRIKYYSQKGNKISIAVRNEVYEVLVNTNWKLDEQTRKNLIQKTGISSFQLNNLLPELYPKGKFNDFNKELLKEWLKLNQYKLPNVHERLSLSNETGLSCAQIKVFCRNFRDKKLEKPLNNEIISEIESWIDKNQRFPNTDEKKLIIKNYGVSHRQIYIILRKIKNNKYLKSKNDLDESNFETENELNLDQNSKSKKDFIFEWLKSNHFKSPNNEERTMLQEKTGYHRDQLKMIIFHYIQIHTPLLNQEKLYIENWVKENLNINLKQSIQKLKIIFPHLTQYQLQYHIRKIKKILK